MTGISRPELYLQFPEDAFPLLPTTVAPHTTTQAQPMSRLPVLPKGSQLERLKEHRSRLKGKGSWVGSQSYSGL